MLTYTKFFDKVFFYLEYWSRELYNILQLATKRAMSNNIRELD
jgi:hypothetical protein